MKSNPREKWLMVCFPAIFTAIIYSWGFARSNSVALSEARKQLQAVSAQPDAQLALSRKAQELSRLEDQYDSYVERKKSAPTISSKPGGSGANRAAALKVLAAAADSSDLVLIQSSTKGEGPSKLSELTAISKGVDLPEPQIWHLEFVGSYLNMLKMLTELKKSETFVVPIDVKMEPLKDETESPSLKWTLTVWI